MNLRIKPTRTATLSFFLFLLFFLTGISLCLKPVCTGLIREAYIGRAVAFRMNDVINEEFPDMELETGISLQEMIIAHPRLDAVISRYLNALVSFCINGSWKEPDTTRLFQALNQDILHAASEKMKLQINADDQQRLLSRLLEAQKEAVDIMNTLPSSSLIRYARPVLILYGVLTSVILRLLCFCLILLCFASLYVKKRSVSAWTKAVSIPALLNGIVTGILLPLLCRAVTLAVTNRFLGRSMYIDTTAFMIAGAVSAAVGFILLLSGALINRKHP